MGHKIVNPCASELQYKQICGDFHKTGSVEIIDKKCILSCTVYSKRKSEAQLGLIRMDTQ